LIIKIWMHIIATFLIRLIFLNLNSVSISSRILTYAGYL
jgi:hypothetical protein